jgi:hypothetical protein
MSDKKKFADDRLERIYYESESLMIDYHDALRRLKRACEALRSPDESSRTLLQVYQARIADELESLELWTPKR